MFSIKLSNHSIRYRLNIFFILIIVATSLALIVPLYFRVSKILKRNTQEQSLETVRQLATGLEHSLDSIVHMANFIAYSSEIQKFLDIPQNETRLQMQDYSAAERVMIVNYSSLVMKNIEVFGNNGIIFNVPSRYTDLPPGKIDTYMLESKKHGGAVSWHNETTDGGNFLLLKEIRNITTTRSLGTISIQLSTEYLEKQLADINFANDGFTCIMDMDGNYIAGAPVDAEILRSLLPLLSCSSGYTQLNFNGQDYLLAYSTLTEKNMSVLGFIPEATLYSEISQLKVWIYMIVLITCILSFLLSVKLSNTITTPLRSMEESMEIAAKGDFSHVLTVTSKDEIGRLSDNFNSMINKINRLIENEYKQELLRKEAEFKMLQAQINPHFLYNALDTINWSARKQGMDDISKMVTAISNLLRISINNHKKNVLVKEELDCINDYLLIQKNRYQNKIITMIDVEPELYPVVIPKLILQPLVENAFVHGLSQTDKKGMILVQGIKQENQIIFTVTDNGIGMNSETLLAVLSDNHTPDSAHTGLGIATIHKRIQYLYGAEYGLSIHSEEGKGTQLTLTIPWQREENHYAKNNAR